MKKRVYGTLLFLLLPSLPIYSGAAQSIIRSFTPYILRSCSGIHPAKSGLVAATVFALLPTYTLPIDTNQRIKPESAQEYIKQSIGFSITKLIYLLSPAANLGIIRSRYWSARTNPLYLFLILLYQAWQENLLTKDEGNEVLSPSILSLMNCLKITNVILDVGVITTILLTLNQ